MNPVTNKIYVANFSSSTVTVIDGATNSARRPCNAGTIPMPVAVNPVTNKIYVANYRRQQRDGDRRRHQHHHDRYSGNSPSSVAVNPVTNKIYVANCSLGGTVTVIDGVTNTTTTVTAGINPLFGRGEPGDEQDLRRQLRTAAT